ncbi:pyrimidine 5'-nucleotidase [Pelagibacteraceae bacterium]|jgi:putative hydrolase of the HAD superfamily|nr:pyrimidine 5'-nucleotidase [Pelagibacteraceae bacterium]|tara:strand:- start:761 stop:1426 length:666 start_codon:yes stop_codon:yes gene_type:complete
MKELTKIQYWLFDLDNTLYSGQTKVFDQVDKKMSLFISEKLEVSIEEAKKIQKNYFHEYNTTLNGMIKNHKIDANEFLEFVHDVDLEFLKIDKPLKREIANLLGKKFIFTNGSKAHAANVTKRIGIDKLFDGVFDIVEADFIPKPSIEPYKKIIDNFKIEPQYCIFIEDIARNLKPAHELGMKTVWIKNDEPWAAEFSNSDFIDYKTDDLANFLKEINELR